VRARRALTEQTLGQDLTNSNLFQNLRVANDGTYLGVGKIGGTMNAIGYASLAAYPLVVGVAMPVDEILAAVRRQNSTYMVVGTIATLAIMTLGWLLMSDAKRRRQHELARHSHFLIQEQKILLDVALDNMSHGLLMFDSSNRLVIYNRRYLEMYGLSADVVRPGCTLRDLVDYRIEAGHFFSADPEQYLAEIQSAFAQNIIFSKTMHLNDGRIISIVHHSIADGGWVATHEDISEARRREDDLRRTNLQFDAALNNMTQGLLMFDEAGKLAISNRRFAEMYQLPWEKWQSLSSGVSPLRSMQLTSELSNIAPKHPEQIAAEIQGILRDHRKDQLIFERTDGRSYTASFGPMSNGGFVVTIDDITERRRKDDQILHMAHYDTLTDLPNRATFNETLGATFDRAAATDKRFAVLSIDLDHFKEANDTYGHLVGDGLLRELARRLQGAAGETFLARLGGDEFALIMADVVQPAAAAALADRLLATCADDFEVEGHRLRLAMSIGIAICPTDGADAKTLMTNADAALYRAKAETRGMAMFFEPEMSVRLRERYALQEDLRLAVDRGELRLYYQPQLKISGEAVGLEALVRWQCPKRGMVEPGTFIPIAEESSLIISLGEWVLREACREAASWPTQLTIAVNISPVQFHHGDLSRLVHTILLETGLAPGRLELEITENVMVDDFSRAVSILNQLKSLGVRIALDDFGTGYSSLSYLQSFRCDKVKIDRIFIRDLEQNRHSRSIVRAVIGLGRSLELVILAEGVETEAQRAILVQEGCDEVQGYLMGRPLPIANYAKLVGGQMVAAHNFAIAG
jgi:diguanylate cyclase (GGDEF)-like protein